jgi:hypothetical protein
MALEPLDKLIIHDQFGQINARVIGLKTLSDNSIIYYVEPLRIDFTRFKNGSRIRRINSREIDNNLIKIEKHN